MDFEEWMAKGYSGEFDMPHPRDAFEAGQQSRQAEVNELRKRIDEINKLVDLWREDYVTLVKYDDGNRYCLEDCINRVVNILEGNTNEY